MSHETILPEKSLPRQPNLPKVRAGPAVALANYISSLNYQIRHNKELLAQFEGKRANGIASGVLQGNTISRQQELISKLEMQLAAAQAKLASLRP
jgi:hypothetical protein